MEYICNYCGKSFGNHKTLFRAHRKVCDCKPDKFICDFCGKEFTKKATCVMHMKYHCKANPEKLEQNHVCGFKIHQERFGASSKKDGWQCNCGKVFRVRRELEQHKKDCDFNKSCLSNGKAVHITYIDYQCEFCKKLFIHKPINSVTLHRKQCSMNPNKTQNRRTGTHHTEEQKKKISEARKKYLSEHPDKVPFKLNHSSKESYPEKYFREWLQKENIFSEREYQVGLYTLDFAWPERKIYLEIDGSQHHLDWMIKHDEERTKKLFELGWICIQRIYWPDYQKLNLEERKNFLLNLKEKIL